MAAPLLFGLAAMQVAGGYFASQNMKETAKLNREIADMNAEFAELDAEEERLKGFSEQARYQGIVDQTLSTQRANLAAADVDINYGSASSIAKETNFVAEINKMELQARAEEAALGLESQARQFRLGGAIEEAQGNARARQALMSGITSGLSTGLSGYKATGGFKSSKSAIKPTGEGGSTTTLSTRSQSRSFRTADF